LFKLIGGNLVAINEVTRKEVISINLRHVQTLVDLNVAESSAAGAGAGAGAGTAVAAAAGQNQDQSHRQAPPPPQSRRSTWIDEEENMFSVRPRSFKLEFDDETEISFWADSDENKAVW
jgi:serine/arginine repetitive matrix protein 2